MMEFRLNQTSETISIICSGKAKSELASPPWWWTTVAFSPWVMMVKKEKVKKRSIALMLNLANNSGKILMKPLLVDYLHEGGPCAHDRWECGLYHK